MSDLYVDEIILSGPGEATLLVVNQTERIVINEVITVPSSGGSGGGGSSVATRANIVPISSGQSSLTVAYSTPLAGASPPIVSFLNTIDPYPIFLQAIITAYSTTGFTAKFNAPTDTANYSLSYLTSEVA